MNTIDPNTYTQLSREYHAAHERRAALQERRRHGETGLASAITREEREIRRLAEELGLIPRRRAA